MGQMGLDRARIVDLGRMDAEPCVLPCKIEPGGTILGGFGPHVGHLGPQGVEGTLSGVDLAPMWAIWCRTPCFTMNLDVHVGHLVQNTAFYEESGRPRWPLDF